MKFDAGITVNGPESSQSGGSSLPITGTANGVSITPTNASGLDLRGSEVRVTKVPRRRSKLIGLLSEYSDRSDLSKMVKGPRP